MPTIKIYKTLSDINNKKLKKVNYYKNYLNDNCYILDLLSKTNIKSKKEKPIYEYKFQGLKIPIEWKYLFNTTNEIKYFKKNNTNIDYFYISSTLDCLTRLNNLKDLNTKLNDVEKEIIEENIKYLYTLPMFSVIVVDFSEEIKNMQMQDFLLLNSL